MSIFSWHKRFKHHQVLTPTIAQRVKSLQIHDLMIWLKTKDEFEYVGNSFEQDSCPLALYLNDIYPNYRFRVNKNAIVIACNTGAEAYFPFLDHVADVYIEDTWMFDFIERIDYYKAKDKQIPAWWAKRTLRFIARNL